MNAESVGKGQDFVELVFLNSPCGKWMRQNTLAEMLSWPKNLQKVLMFVWIHLQFALAIRL